MSLPPPSFHTARTIGTGQSNPGDVRRLRRALQRVGYGRFPSPGAPNVTPGLIETTKRFQRDFGLKPDAVVTPGGPTERALSIALATRANDAEPAMARLRDTFAARASAGLSFRPHPEDRHAGIWLDAKGRALSDSEADAIVARAGSRGTQLAMMRRGDQLRRPWKGLLEGGGTGVPRGSMSAIGSARTLDSVARQASEHSTIKEASDGRWGDDPMNPGRTFPPANLPTQLPPSPADPPKGFDGREEYPAEERRPTLLVTPIPEERKPEVEIFPDLSDIIEQWLVVENSRGLIQ